MSPPHSGARIGRPFTGVKVVRELPLVLEPVTRDPFIDDERRLNSSQRDMVRESLLRCPGLEART
jgi:hypothetical protein